jgi:mRNA-degrading endonuclease RelE of RelBE toxin-antitoxin system
MSEGGVVEVQFSIVFLRRLKDLEKRYQRIEKDIQPVIERIEAGEFPGDQIAGTGFVVLKVRAKNRDIPIGKSGGYRLIYQMVTPQSALLLLVYAKSDQADVALEEILDAIKRGATEK